MEEKKVNIREMTMEDFEEVHALWMGDSRVWNPEY